ncbi:hypothetical protein BD779DRAFT_1790867 [Infundibulicybe gibba]|nr:hypothetical protein BD779DRAFT_1790867 [Infundibulicybe gibba]
MVGSCWTLPRGSTSLTILDRFLGVFWHGNRDGYAILGRLGCRFDDPLSWEIWWGFGYGDIVLGRRALIRAYSRPGFVRTDFGLLPGWSGRSGSQGLPIASIHVRRFGRVVLVAGLSSLDEELSVAQPFSGGFGRLLDRSRAVLEAFKTCLLARGDSMVSFSVAGLGVLEMLGILFPSIWTVRASGRLFLSR